MLVRSPYTTCGLCGHQWKRDFRKLVCTRCHGIEERAEEIKRWREIEVQIALRRARIMDLAKGMAKFFRENGIDGFDKELIELDLYE